MTPAKVMNRWLVVVGAISVQLALGAIYAWSVFTPTLKDAGWSATETQVVFAAGLVTFAIVMVLAGRLMSRIGPRTLTILGGLVLGSGYLIAGLLGTTTFWPIFFLIGIVGGAGIGLAYVVPIAVSSEWFPDKKGAILGLSVAGFGFGAMGWVKLAGSWGHLIETIGLESTFTAYGIAFGVMVVFGGIFMIHPPAGWKPAGFTPPLLKSAAVGDGALEFTSSQMLRTRQFYMVFLCFAAAGGAGLMSIGLMKLYPMQALMGNGYTELEASAIAGTAMAVFFSLGNGFGRILWGALSDVLRRKRSMVIMLGTQGILVLLFPYMAGGQWALWLFALLIGFNYGGAFAIFPAVTGDIFGNKHVGQNYPWIFLAYGVGGTVGPIMGGKLGDMNNFPLAFTICGVAVLAASGIAMMIRPPRMMQTRPENQTATSGGRPPLSKAS